MSEPTTAPPKPKTGDFLELTLKNRELLGARQSLGRLALYKPKSYSLGYRVGKNADAIEDALKQYFKSYNEILEEHGVMDEETGRKVAPKEDVKEQKDALDAFTDALEVILNEESQVTLRVIPTEMLDNEGDDFPLTMLDLNLIVFMVAE